MLGSGSGSGSGSGFLPRGRASGSRQRGSAYFDAGNYDITPWAREVITRIQNNWTIPQAKGGADRGEVGIVAAIGKDGSLKEIKILNATNVSLLDEAALRAVEQSAPFPALPPDFPRTILEAYFVFKYGE
jgi:protein TonB